MRKILRGHVFNIRFLFTLCAGFIFLSETNAQVSGTFTINSGAPASGTNFQTFSAAVASLATGVNGAVTFNVSGGPYNEQVIINAIAGTSATNTVTFNCNGVILTFLSTNYNQRAGVKLNGADYVTFDNLNVQPQAATGGQYGYGFHLLNDADHNTIKNCHITNFVDWDNTDDHEGIVINGDDGISYDVGNSLCDDNLIQNNTITGGSVGITLSSIPASGAPVLMTGNKIIGNTFSNTIFYAIQMFYTSGTLIDGNDISGGPDAVYDLIGMYFDYYNESFTVSKNRIHGFHLTSGSTAYGMYISSDNAAGKDCFFTNNLIYDFQTDGDVIGFLDRAVNGYLNIYNNTISLDDQSIAGGNASGIFFQAAITNVNVMNNIITITRKSSGQNFGMVFGRVPVQYASQRNVIYVPDDPNSTDGVASYNRVTYNSMADWQKASGYDYYSTDIDPLYTNTAGFNFRPTAQVIDNMAVYVNLDIDITGASRNTTNPDAGCFEFTSTACSSTITPGTANVLPDSVLCVGPKISLGLTGYSAGGGQTYTWQSSPSSTGTYTNIASPLGFPYLETTPATTLYYRVALTCGTTTAYSNPVRVLVNTALNGGTYTINSALPTGGINFNSFTDAARALGCSFNGSIVFNVASGSGPYNEQLILPALPTSPTKTITFNGNGATITFAPRSSDSSAVVKLNGTDYITIDSLNVDVQGATTFGFGIQLLNDADHNTIKRCTVNLNKTATNLRYAGIVVNSVDDDPIYDVDASNCDSNLIANNTVNGGCYGITLASRAFSKGQSKSTYNFIRNNKVRDNSKYGIFIAGASYSTIDSNDISQPTRTALYTIYGGIYVYEYNIGLTISKNIIHNLGEAVRNNKCQFDGIRCENGGGLSTDPLLINNNLMYTWRGSDFQTGMSNINSDFIKYYHNTVSLDDSSSADPSITRGFSSAGALTTAVEVKDNNFVIRRGGNGAKHGIYTNLNDSGLIANYNNYYVHSYTGPSYIGFMTKDYPTLADWVKTRKDSSSISIDPVFFDMAKGDYTPTKIPFENQGHPVGITTDMFNAVRNAARPDIGAIEFTICRDLSNPVVSVEDAQTNIIKFSWLPVVNTTGYRVSRDSLNWTIPSSGALGLSHTVTGLHPTDEVSLWVKALGTRADCPEYLAPRIIGKALAGGVFIPNTFTPNNDGKNDKFKLYSNVTKSVRWMVFNQWGEKVFESNDIQGEWDGTYKGKPQPVGVYVYVVSGMLTDGTKVNQKGTFNLVR
jgi:gliding motility-associated-like protein